MTISHLPRPSVRTAQLHNPAPAAATTSATRESWESQIARARTQPHPPTHARVWRARRWPVVCTPGPALSPPSRLVMALSPHPFLLTDLSWSEVERHLARERRLLIPVGVCDQYGPHLPIGCSTVVAEAIVETLARDFAIIQAPTFPLGVNFPSERTFSGTSGAREKTLHRLLNDALASWEDSGFEEFILVTAHDYDPHVEALASVSGTRSRVRVIEILGIDFSEFLDGRGGPQHGGEVLTSLMLYLRPDKVNRALAEDFHLPGEASDPRRIHRLPADSPGSIGDATLASAEKGQRIFEHILQKIRSKVILDPPDDDG